MVELSNLDLHIIIVCLALLLPKYRQFFAAQPLRIDEWQQEIILVDGAGHVEPFRADRSELLVFVVQPIEPFLEVQELQVHFAGM